MINIAARIPDVDGFARNVLAKPMQPAFGFAYLASITRRGYGDGRTGGGTCSGWPPIR